MGSNHQEDGLDQGQAQPPHPPGTLRGVLARYFSRHLPGVADVDDLVQEVFLRVVARGDSEDLDRFEGYVFKTAASVIKDRQRRMTVRAPSRHLTHQPNYHEQSGFDLEQMAIGHAALAAVGHRIMALPERSRTIFALRRLEGLTLPQIARQLGLSLSEVEQHIQRAARQVLSEGEERP